MATTMVADAAELANTHGRTLALRQGGVLAAQIRFEDTDERAALKAAGFRWDSIGKFWALKLDVAAKRAMVDALFARGYVFAVEGSTQGSIGHRLGQMGIPLTDARLVRFGRKGRWESQDVAVIEAAAARYAALQA